MNSHFTLDMMHMAITAIEKWLGDGGTDQVADF